MEGLLIVLTLIYVIIPIFLWVKLIKLYRLTIKALEKYVQG